MSAGDGVVVAPGAVDQVHPVAMSEPVDSHDAREDVAPEEMAWSNAPVVDQLVSWAEQRDWTDLADFAEQLGRRRDQLWDRGRDVATREQELAQRSPGMAAEGAVPAAAVAARLRTLIVETGDDVATVAATMGVEPAWARGVLTGEVTHADPLQVRRMCLALESTPYDLFGATGPGSHLMPATMDWETSPVRQLVDAAGFLAPQELRAHVAALDAPGRRELVDALAHRHGVLTRWSEGLDAREGRLAQALPPGRGPQREPDDPLAQRFPAAPAAAQIAILAVDTGDDLDAVARALGMEPAWVRGVVGGDIDSLDAGEARRLCAGLELDPTAVFGHRAAGLDGNIPSRVSAPADERGDRVLDAIDEELGIEAGERGLVGRDRDDWVGRQLDELTDIDRPLPDSGRAAVALAADYRKILSEGPGVVPFDPFIHDPLYRAQALDLPDPPGLDFGPF